LLDDIYLTLDYFQINSLQLNNLQGEATISVNNSNGLIKKDCHKYLLFHYETFFKLL